MNSVVVIKASHVSTYCNTELLSCFFKQKQIKELLYHINLINITSLSNYSISISNAYYERS